MNIVIYAMNIVTHSKLTRSDNRGSDNQDWTMLFKNMYWLFVDLAIVAGAVLL